MEHISISNIVSVMIYKCLKYMSFSLCVILLIYGGWLLLRCFVVDYFTIKTSSMNPTLQSGDKVFVNKLLMGPRIYKSLHFVPSGQDLESWRLKGLRMLRQNDIVVFNFPHHEGRISFVINNVYCKRIVGMPGDSLRIVDGHYRNNNYGGVLGTVEEQARLEQTPDSLLWPSSLPAIPFDDHFAWTIRHFGPMYIPRKGDVMRVTPYEATLYHILLEWETGQPIACDWDRGEVWAGEEHFRRHQWKHNYYFMAGDNVLDSNDSRYWGLVPEEYIVGVVHHIVKKGRDEV